MYHPSQQHIVGLFLGLTLLSGCGGSMIEDLPLTPALQHYVALSKIKQTQAEIAQVESILRTLDTIIEEMEEMGSQGSKKASAKSTPDDIAE